MDQMGAEHSQRRLAAYETAVGLSDGLMEVRYVVRIDAMIKKRQFHKNENVLENLKRAKGGNGRLHLLGLIPNSFPSLS
ncbi:hypothetical protein K438DRAFT_1998444 [Mycena galopus ATCC 62051]|nr:hypothetical protein K438DRAFT_1998444 [Mycena galopus ATCC 62051]